MPLATVVYRGAIMPSNTSTVEVRVRFWMSPIEFADCQSPFTWDPFPADSANSSLVEVNLPYQAYDDFRGA